MRIYHRVLSNGLRVVLVPMRSQTTKVYLNLAMRGGPRYESPEELGISHLLEHLLAYGQEPIKALEEFGDTDAETWVEEVTFKADFPRRKLRRGLALFAQALAREITARDVEKESRILRTEYASYLDGVDQEIRRIFHRTLWGEPLSRIDSGSWGDNLANLTAEKVEDFRSRALTGENLVLVLAGDFKVRPALRLIEQYFGALPKGEPLRPIPTFRKEPQGPLVIGEHRSTHLAYCVLGFETISRRDSRRMAQVFLSAYLSGDEVFGLHHRLVVENRLVYEVGCETATYLDTGLLVIEWSCLPENVPAALDLVLRELRDLRQNGIEREEFLLAGKKITREFKEDVADSPEELAEVLAKQILASGKVASPDEITRHIQKVSPKAVQRFAWEYLDPSRAVLVVAGPIEDR